MAYVLKAAAIAAIFAAAVGDTAAQAQSAKLEMNQVPPHIAAAARAAGGFDQITEAGVEIEAGRMIFELKGRSRDGRVREVDVLMSGEIEEIEEEIQQNDVPPPVMQAVQQWMANFRPTKIERSERPVPGGNGATFMVYEFEGQHGGMDVDVEVSADGSRLMIVDDTKG
ncbi:hypothetical protein [Belnapia sp. F-4-1]|uniref:hypothetical protein n=1 Tax=Belnapia sp. F-4-1 TaxID=1545443 RepID=UPI0005BC1767|nr:hypothetical protein [Belnapia sp. F-4-1]